jgi:hypothetical protein
MLASAVMTPRIMPKTVLAFIVLATPTILGLSLEAAEKPRYFREDHLTGARYLALTPAGKYSLVFREHAGVWVAQSGLWSRSGERTTFTPKVGTQNAFVATEVHYRGTNFLTWEQEKAPGIVIPIEQTKKELDNTGAASVLYVFFEISEEIYKGETALAYPFRTRTGSKAAGGK